MEKATRTTVLVEIVDGTAEQQSLAESCAKILEEIINQVKFTEKVKLTKFASPTRWNENGRYVKVSNDEIIQIIKQGRERGTMADNQINLMVALKQLRDRTVGAVKPGELLITTNISFFDRWTEKSDFVSLAAHWLHEWLHVAGFLHKSRFVNRKDISYAIGRITVEIGKELTEDNKPLKAFIAKGEAASLGKGYLDAMEAILVEETLAKFAALDVSSSSQKSLQLGFVDLGTDLRPVAGRSYPIISAGNARLETLPVPMTTFRVLKMDILAFFNDHMPDFLGGTKEGLFKVSINTRNPQTPTAGENDVTVAIDFKVKDGQYAPGFLYKGVFRNVLFSDWINLRFDLFELDTDAEVYYNKVKGVVDSVPELRNLDILNGVPYLNLASKLFEGIIKTFGKNADDHMWKEMPTLEITPSIGGAFLRSGIYVIFQRTNSKKEVVTFDHLLFKDNHLEIKDNSLRRLSNHMLVSIGLGESGGM